MGYVTLNKLTISNYSARDLNITNFNYEMQKIRTIINAMIDNSVYLKENFETPQEVLDALSALSARLEVLEQGHINVLAGTEDPDLSEMNEGDLFILLKN